MPIAIPNNDRVSLLTMTDGSQPSGLPQTGLAVDSISLGQLRSMVGNNQRPKQSWFDFKYAPILQLYSSPSIHHSLPNENLSKISSEKPSRNSNTYNSCRYHLVLLSSLRYGT